MQYVQAYMYSAHAEFDDVFDSLFLTQIKYQHANREWSVFLPCEHLNLITYFHFGWPKVTSRNEYGRQMRKHRLTFFA